MKSIVNPTLKNLPTILLLVLAAILLAVVVETRDPGGLLGWLFCFATMLTARQPAPSLVPVENY